MADTGGFSVGDKVMVPHQDKKMYEAKILKLEKKDDGKWHYFLHYNGWNKKYDEWVESSGVTRVQSDASAAAAAAQAKAGPKKLLQKNFQQASTAQKKLEDLGLGGSGSAASTALGGGAAAAGAAASAAGGDAAGGAGGATGGAASASTIGGGSMLELMFPLILKQQLLEDYNAVVEEGRLVPLPRRPSVAEMLAKYLAEVFAAKGSCINEEEVSSGLKTYFDKSLSALLLYRSERSQSASHLADGRVPSAVYGPEHLLRLFIKLPDLFSAAGVSGEEQLAQLGAMCQDVLNWMADNATTIFLPKSQYIAGDGS